MSIDSIDPNISAATSRTKSLQSATQRDATDKELMETCKEFESMFIKQMLDSMNKTVTKSGLIEENMGEEIFTDMLNDEYSQKMADTSGFGIAEMMYKQLASKKYE